MMSGVGVLQAQAQMAQMSMAPSSTCGDTSCTPKIDCCSNEVVLDVEEKEDSIEPLSFVIVWAVWGFAWQPDCF